MREIDALIREYEGYRPELTRREDFNSFWDNALSGCNSIPLRPRIEEIKYPIKQVKVERIIYQGAYETPIKAFYIKPVDPKEKLKCIIFYHGYGGSKGSISQYMTWLIQGYAVLTVDCRGMGETGDDSKYSYGNTGSWATQGLLVKEEYYYYKVWLDCKRAVDFIMEQSEIDPNAVCLMGSSLGGGIAMAVAALDSRPALVVAEVPNMCDIELTIKQKMEGSLVEIEKFMKLHPEYMEKVLTNLSYFDILNHASNIKSKIRVSVAFKDLICPPKPIFGVYNHITSEKSMEIYPFSGHDAPGTPSHIEKTIYYVNTKL
ncbi:acetylxylan esterase [Pseudalkalibacillus salsuginis]|uniref:acetylxylan esterase n=1 Tax=Pseudalkalibacillus salsuginis TaxID=2910972 RepID=UPI001F3424E8|nr:alpha/beta fold hydrolase [Pseudalkalibacillus salsuginis]MCF6411625.1 acetylxylan esterase [Pseudalkalibacillus salsuginis]